MNRKGKAILSCGIVILLAITVGVMTITDKGVGLQLNEVLINEVKIIDVVSTDDSVVVKQGEGDKITLSLMSSNKNSSKLSYSLKNGKLVVSTTSKPTFFNLSLNPNRMKNEPLEITIPASSKINTLNVQSKDGKEVVIEKVNVDSIKVATNNSNITMVGMEGNVTAQTKVGKITSTSTLSSKIEKAPSDSYTYKGQVGQSSKSSITLSSDSGNITFK